MCGILGSISFKNQYKFNHEEFDNALKLLNHRGPDDSHIIAGNNFIFGHQRLSIIDLSISARQPMVSSCGNYSLVFNGEIYNFEEIREDLIKKGYVFNTSSDTEVLLNSFIEYGIECIDLFIGMFAFAVHDESLNVTYIVRDRLGIKPLYYFKNDEKLIFSSEIKSILKLESDINREINMDAISSYFSFRYPILNDTFFKDIFSLPPASYMKISDSNIELVEYWNASQKFKEQEADRGEKYYIEKLQRLLESAVKYRMIADVPIGSYLSGGVDSSIISAIMAKNSDRPIKTYTIGFKEDGYNEFDYANIIKNKYKTDHTEILLSEEDYFKNLTSLIGFKDAPLSVPNEVPLYMMTKELKKSITVVLSGEGADEIFGGYGRIFRSPHDYNRIKNIDNLELSEEEKNKLCENFIKKYTKSFFNSELEHFYNIYSYTSIEEKKDLLSKDIDLKAIDEKFHNKIMSFFNELKDDSYYNKIMYTFEKIHLLGLLQRVDITTMAASVEARVPFVDHRLVEFAFTIPTKYKIKWNNEKSKEESKLLMSDKISEEFDTPKYILKKAYEGTIPDSILYRKKVGFPAPLHSWLGGNFNKYAKKILLSKKATKRGIYNIEKIKEWLESNRLATDHGFAMKIWMLINIELFMLKYFDAKSI